MRIESVLKYTTATSAFLSAVGYMGAHIVKPILTSVSPFGVALTCGQIPWFFWGILASGPTKEATIASISFAVIASYPLAVLSSNIAFQVQLIDPIVCALTGGTALIASGGVVFITAYIFSKALGN